MFESENISEATVEIRGENPVLFHWARCPFPDGQICIQRGSVAMLSPKDFQDINRAWLLVICYLLFVESNNQ